MKNDTLNKKFMELTENEIQLIESCRFCWERIKDLKQLPFKNYDDFMKGQKDSSEIACCSFISQAL